MSPRQHQYCFQSLERTRASSTRAIAAMDQKCCFWVAWALFSCIQCTASCAKAPSATDQRGLANRANLRSQPAVRNDDSVALARSMQSDAAPSIHATDVNIARGPVPSSFPPLGHFIWLQGNGPISTFPTASGIVAVSSYFNDPHAHFTARPWISWIENGSCNVLSDTNGLPEIGTVDLNKDSAKRWGFRKGGSEAGHNIANVASRYAVGAGLYQNGEIWVAFQTDAQPAVVDLYVHQKDHWNLEWSSYPQPTVWAAATTRVGVQGVAAVTATPSSHVGAAPSHWALWARDDRRRISRKALELSPAEIHPSRSLVLMKAFADEAYTVVTCESSGSAAIERIFLRSGKSHVTRLSDVTLCSVPRRKSDCLQPTKLAWGVQFESPQELLLWRMGSEALRVSCTPSLPCSYGPDRDASSVVRRGIGVLGTGEGCSLEILDNGVQVLNLQYGSNWYLLGTQELQSACPAQPKNQGGKL